MRVQKTPEAAFTLIEMMVVVAIIGILIAGVFRLIAAAGENTKRAITLTRMEKLQNVLAGYYAEYGTYPPVERIRSADPKIKDAADGQDNEKHESSLSAGNANAAAGAQPLEFTYPSPKSMDKYINIIGDGKYVSVNTALGGQVYSEESWHDTKLFKFGLLSFLLPRVELMGGKALAEERYGGSTPSQSFFKCRQWTRNNVGSLEAVWTRENHACARWMPNFEGTLSGGGSIFGINVTAPHENGLSLVGPFKTGGSASYMLLQITIKDGWGRSLYYYSPPPYQSYRIWSAGPNGNTFPPWVDIKSIPSSDRHTVSGWIKDDLTRFDQ